MKVDIIALSIPFFFLLIGVELAYSYFKKLHYYRLNDSLSNLSQGIGQQLIGIFMKTILFFGYSYIYDHWRLFDLPATLWVWFLLFIGVDFFYYWFHRMSHQVNALWAAHVVHHQSEEYNLTVALRQSWFQGWFSWVFYLPLALIGFKPMMFLTLIAFNLLYQFWIHTKLIGNLGWLEYILNTPSHHRVHHGSNPKYIDKNHGGTLIIWDRMFNTFQKEEEPVYYGVTTPLASWNPVWANFHHWFDIFRSVRKAGSWKDKLLIFIKPPGWQPAIVQADDNAYKTEYAYTGKYDSTADPHLTAYSFFQFIIALSLGSVLLFKFTAIEMFQAFSLAAFIILTLVSCGALFEDKKWLMFFEYIRLLLSFALIPLFAHHCPALWLWLIGGLEILSLIWFILISPKIKIREG